jgi:hypothetical protein
MVGSNLLLFLTEICGSILLLVIATVPLVGYDAVLLIDGGCFQWADTLGRLRCALVRRQHSQRYQRTVPGVILLYPPIQDGT